MLCEILSTVLVESVVNQQSGRLLSRGGNINAPNAALGGDSNTTTNAATIGTDADTEKLLGDSVTADSDDDSSSRTSSDDHDDGHIHPIGSRVEVWWTADKCWYKGTVADAL